MNCLAANERGIKKLVKNLNPSVHKRRYFKKILNRAS
jgi:hypothetical protein